MSPPWWRVVVHIIPDKIIIKNQIKCSLNNELSTWLGSYKTQAKKAPKRGLVKRKINSNFLGTLLQKIALHQLQFTLCMHQLTFHHRQGLHLFVH
jgi:hypothetical protein